MLGFPPPGNARLNEIAKTEDTVARYNELNTFKEELRLATMQRTKDLFALHPMQVSTFAVKYGVSISMAHRISKGERAIPVEILAHVCYQEFETSCSELVFGEKPQIIVPNEINAVICCSKKSNANLETIAASFSKRCVARVVQRSDSTLLQTRINERVNQVGLVIREQMAYYPWYSAFYKRLRFSAKENERLPGHLSSLLVTSWSVGMPIDYLLALDYTWFSDLYYRNNTRLEKLPKSLYPFISVYLRLNPKDRVELIRKCLQMT